jgi:hypothetical protein
VTISLSNFVVTWPHWHTTVVDDNHAAVGHKTSCKDAVTVKSAGPKLRPLTVTDAIPLIAKLAVLLDKTAESNEKGVVCVPACAPTVIDNSGMKLMTGAV